MEISEARIRSLMRQARRVAADGKRAAASTLYKEIVEAAPDVADAWVGLAETTSQIAEKEMAYRRALELAPDNEKARLGLARLTGDEDAPEPAPGTPEAVELPSDPPGEAGMAHIDTPQAETTAVAADSPLQEPRAVDDGREHGAGKPGEPLVTADETVAGLVCYRHPDRETSLRCYTCERPICVDCAIKTPVGYRCPVCIREAEDVFFTATPIDYVIAFLISFPLSLIAGVLALRLGGGFLFIFLTFIVGGAIGSFIGRVTFRAIGRRRGRYVPYIVAANVIIGVLIPLAIGLVLFGALPSLSSLLVPGIYLFVATSAAFYQVK